VVQTRGRKQAIFYNVGAEPLISGNQTMRLYSVTQMFGGWTGAGYVRAGSKVPRLIEHPPGSELRGMSRHAPQSGSGVAMAHAFLADLFFL